MEQNFKKVEAKFKFLKNWIDASQKEQTVALDLVINYHSKNFSITPHSQVAGKFTFCQGSANSAMMWIAILDTIKEATYFAQKELEFQKQ
jgi:hypothetical protein